MVAIRELIGFVEKKVLDLDNAFLCEALSHQEIALANMIEAGPFGA